VKFHKRAIYYILRQRNKTILLGSVFMLALLIGILGIALLQSFEQSLEDIRKQSKAKITMYVSDIEEFIPQSQVKTIQLLENIDQVNRVNELVIPRPNDFEISLAADENQEEGQIRLQGFDDLTMDSVFSQELAFMVEGNMMKLNNNEIFINEALAMMNNVTIGDEVTLQNEAGEEVKAIIKGLYKYDHAIENEVNAPSMMRTENIIFVHPSFINQLQGEEKYVEVHFYVANPEIIQETRQQIQSGSFDIRISDALYRQMSQPLLQSVSLTSMILMMTGIVTIAVISLLLTLWSRERRKETALLLSIGESKGAIIIQRLLEVFIIYLGAFIFSSVFAYVLVINVDLEIFQISEVMIIFLTGIFTILFAVSCSCMSMMRSSPRAIFSAND